MTLTIHAYFSDIDLEFLSSIYQLRNVLFYKKNLKCTSNMDNLELLNVFFLIEKNKQKLSFLIKKSTNWQKQSRNQPSCTNITIFIHSITIILLLEEYMKPCCDNSLLIYFESLAQHNKSIYLILVVLIQMKVDYSSQQLIRLRIVFPH